MSYDTDMLVWVSDLDEYINIDAISRNNEHEAEEEALEAELERLGDIALFSRKSISSRTIYSRGVGPEQWRWMKHRAETSLSQDNTPAEVEADFLNAIMTLARRYAVARYARLEDLSFSSAITATFPHGIRALLYQFMTGEQSLSDISCRNTIQKTLHYAASSSKLTAYDQVGLVQRSLHELAIDVGGANADQRLNKDGMRRILSLLRLHFSVRECQVQSVSELQEMNLRYKQARIATEGALDAERRVTGSKIRNWRMRSLHPLTFYFPYCVRNSLSRLISQVAECDISPEPNIATNELALIYCGIELMKRSAKEKADRSE